MSVTCVVQARMASSRLPGKVLAEIAGRPMLSFLLRRLAPLDVAHLVVATTTSPADDAIAELGRAEGAQVLRGPEDDVLARFGRALERFPASSVVRITADCPLADPELVRAALALRAATGADYVSNTLVRTFPDGLDIEVIAADPVRTADTEAVDGVEREHVTPFVQRRPERFTLRSLRHSSNLGDLRWTVDTSEDLERVRRIVERVGRTDFAWQEALAAAEAPGAADDRLSLLPAMAGDSAFVLALRNEPASVRWSRTRRAVDSREHAKWFADLLGDPGSRIWIARERGRPVGQVRIDVREGVGTVAIAVEADRREQGLGRWILGRLDAALRADEQVHTLAAEMHRENTASLRLFRRAGYTEAGKEGDFVIMRRARR